MLDGVGWVLIVAGTGFMVAGTVGLLRFPDTLTRLHALTKADNVGLGLLALGLAVQAATWQWAALYLVTWVLVLLASGPLSNLFAMAVLNEERERR